MKIARKNIMKVKPYIPGKPIEELERELGISGAIKLASNENAVGPSRKVLAAARKALLEVNRYPDGGCFCLKNAIAKKMGVSVNNIVVGNGSDELIVLATRAFVEKGDEVIVARPTFLIYEVASLVQGATVKYAPLKDYRYDVERIAGLVSKKTKLIFIANPDNPTGSYLTAGEIRYLVSKVPGNVLLFFDEAYNEFAREFRDYPDTVGYLGRKNVIITRTFSKVHSLAGLRVGYALANKAVKECLDRVREPFNVNSVAQAAALAALGDTGHVRKSVKLVSEGREYLCGELDSMGLRYVPSATNFVLVKVPGDSAKVYKKLLGRGVIVREMSAWALKNFIRVTVGTKAENRRFIKALREVL